MEKTNITKNLLSDKTCNSCIHKIICFDRDKILNTCEYYLSYLYFERPIRISKK